VNISIYSAVTVTGFSPQEARDIAALDPAAVIFADEHVIRLGRAALATLFSLPACQAATVADNRVYDPHGEVIDAPFLPKHYDLQAAVDATCGVFFLSGQCWRTGLPNIVRNLAALTGQRPTVVTPSPALLRPFFSPISNLKSQISASASPFPKGGQGDFSAFASPFPKGGQGDFSSLLLDSTPPPTAGLVILALPPVWASCDSPLLAAFAASNAAYRFAVLPPSRAAYSLAAEHYPSLGPVVYNNAKFAACDVIPVATPFNQAVRGSRARFYAVNQRETSFAIATNRQRNQLAADLIQRTASLRNIILVPLISQAHELVPALSHLKPAVLAPLEYMSSTARAQVIADANASRACTIIATPQDLAHYAARLKPCDCAYVLSPAPVKILANALAPVRKHDPASFTPDAVRRIYILVDADADLSSRAMTCAEHLARQPLTVVTTHDTRYIS